MTTIEGPELTLALESRLVNAWPAFEVEIMDGWLLRFAEGYSKRANSASPLAAGARLTDDLIDAILTSFAARGVAPCFRLTGLQHGDAEALLERRGFVDYDPSLGMVAPLAGDHAVCDAVTLDAVPGRAWIAAAAHAYGGDKANGDILGRIVRMIRQPAAFATLSLDSEPLAWGLAVAERGFVGLYDIVVAPDRRGAGLGRRLVSHLLAWGHRHGATCAYLQLRETNRVADTLYRSLGFAPAYRYRHRIPPAV